MRKSGGSQAGDDVRTEAVVRIWRESHLRAGSIAQYLQWVRRFRAHCVELGLSVSSQLTLAGVEAFSRRYSGPRRRRRAPALVRGPARRALFAWAHALRQIGCTLPEWKPARTLTSALPPLIAEYVAYRRQHRDVAAGTLLRDVPTAMEFVATLRGRPVGRAQVADIDRFVARLASRQCKRTVADTCSSLRGFLRFLTATGRLNRDLAALVVAPRVRRFDRPPRALPWRDVCRVLRAARGDAPIARRDQGVLLLMAAYGLGAAEVVALSLDAVDWSGGTLRVRRPKTGATILLPLLPAVAQALASYLKCTVPHCPGAVVPS